MDEKMQNLTKRNLAIRIAEETNLTQQQVVAVIQKTLDSIVDALRAGQTIEFRKFGVFDVRERRQRIGRAPLLCPLSGAPQKRYTNSPSTCLI